MGARRERYARAIESAGGVAYPMDFYLEADAVMAVADEEMAPLRLAAKTVTDNDWYGRLGRAEDTLQRVREFAESTGPSPDAAEVLRILEGGEAR